MLHVTGCLDVSERHNGVGFYLKTEVICRLAITTALWQFLIDIECLGGGYGCIWTVEHEPSCPNIAKGAREAIRSRLLYSYSRPCFGQHYRGSVVMRH